ncbi:MAG: T9SS type A sorting domain-containing protein [Flavobacteriales bacterium]|nr:T9SS type A sorting domain-containing protein [Flavobacteriales bacterium]
MKQLFTVVLALLCAWGQAQWVPQTAYEAKSSDPQWIQLLYSENPNALEVREAYESYYQTHEFVKNEHTQYYKRWIRVAMLTMDNTGNVLPLPYDTQANTHYLEKYAEAQMRDGGEWEEMGPWHYDPEVAMYFQVQSPGACHIYTVEQAPSDADVVWAGGATSGIWKSTDKGMHWQLMSSDLLVTSVYSIAIHPTNPDIVYFGEGDGIIYKTTDGGLTWNMTGDADFQGNPFWCRDLKMLPGDPESLIACTNEGLKITHDGGATWTNEIIGEYMEVEFHPTNPDVIYVVRLLNNKTTFIRSTDGGENFTAVGDGWPNPAVGAEQKRCEIAVSAAAPDRVYVLASGSENGGSGLYGIYISEDMGDTFTFQCCGDSPAGVPEAANNPNTLGWSEDGSGDGGQYYYDLGLDVSPTQPDLLFSAGICVWRSADAGQNWSLNGHWVTWAGEFTADRYTHADVHDVKFFTTTDGDVDMWVASDGGLFYSSDQGDHMEPRMYGIQGTDFWGWQSGARHGSVMVGGTYHNGTLIKNGDLYYWGADSEDNGGWLAELAGDNFRGFVNPGDSTIGYHDGGSFRYSTDRFTRISGLPFDNSKRPNTSYWWGEYGNMEWDPACYQCIYSPVETALWHTTDGGTSWEMVYDFGGSKIVNVKVAARDRAIIYVTQRTNGGSWRIWRTADAGATWNDITPSDAIMGNNNGASKYIDVHGTDPNVLYFVTVGNQTGYQVFKTADGGTTWENLSGSNLNGQFTTAIWHQRGTEDGLYVSTDKAVYYRNATMEDWEMYNNNLPARTPSVFLQGNYCEGKIRSAGSRGVHQCDFYEDFALQASFMASQTVINLGVQCESDTIRFVDNSVVRCGDLSYEWNFNGGTVVEDLGDEMLVLFSALGSYDVSMTITDGNGNSDTWNWADLIQVIDEPVGFPVTEDFNNGMPPEFWKIVDLEGGGHWEQGTVLGDETNHVAQFPNYWVDTQGQTDLLVFPAQDFSDIDNALLHFDVSYQTYADYIDGLEVVYRTANSEDWIPLYSKSGSDLAVEGNYTWFWYDQGGTLLWRTDTVDLSVLAGEPCVTLAFSNIGGYGNHIWIDNVNLTFATDVEDQPGDLAFSMYPNPAENQLFIQFPAHTKGAVLDIYDAQGKWVISRNMNAGSYVDISSLRAGVYYVALRAGERRSTQKLVVSR